MSAALYIGVGIKLTDDNCSRPFKFLSACTILRGHQHFSGRSGAKNSCNKTTKKEIIKQVRLFPGMKWMPTVLSMRKNPKKSSRVVVKQWRFL